MANYINSKELYTEILISKTNGALTPNALMMLDKMVKEISKIFKYKMEEDREDCQAFAMEDVIKYWNRFDPEKSNNAFSYFTSIIRNGNAKGWRRLHPVKTSKFVSINKDFGVFNL